MCLKVIEGVLGHSVDGATIQTILWSIRRTREALGPGEVHRLQNETTQVIPIHASASLVERQNWSLRARVQRMTRLSNGFSRNHGEAIALN